jgi:DNA-binding XRE family transcriptional regulator
MDRRKIHIGKLIQTFVKENHINSAELARNIGKTRQNIYDLYKRDDVEVKLLLAISEVLNHNFFEDIYPQKKSEHSIDYVFDTLKALVTEQISKG